MWKCASSAVLVYYVVAAVTAVLTGHIESSRSNWTKGEARARVKPTSLPTLRTKGPILFQQIAPASSPLLPPRGYLKWCNVRIDANPRSIRIIMSAEWKRIMFVAMNEAVSPFAVDSQYIESATTRNLVAGMWSQAPIKQARKACITDNHATQSLNPTALKCVRDKSRRPFRVPR